MTEETKSKIQQVVNTFAKLTKLQGENLCQKLITHLCSMNNNDVVDYLIVSLSDLIDKGKIQTKDVLNHLNLITTLSKDYPTPEALIARLNWLKAMNMTHTKMPLTENHKLVTEVFDKFNQIIRTDFDAYYTGGLMGYLATNHPLERYHSDLDLFVNETQLDALYQKIKQSDDFKFVSNLDKKTDHTGHEFKINYKDTPMSVGLFLFERKPDNKIILKSYYYAQNGSQTNLLVDEKHLIPDYANLFFTDNICEHNYIPYRMQSLESIFLSKQGPRPKDQYDAKIMEPNVNLFLVNKLNLLKPANQNIVGNDANTSLIAQFINRINYHKQPEHQI